MIIKIQMKDIWESDNGKEPCNNSPAFDYCRKLIKDGEDENSTLEVWRDDVLCLIFKNIGEAAEYTIKENSKEGPKIVKYRPSPYVKP